MNCDLENMNSDLEIMNSDLENMETGFSEVTDEDLNELNEKNDSHVKNEKADVGNEQPDIGEMSDGFEPDTADVSNVEERSVVMNNNFILPMESVETEGNMEDEKASKKQKREKKDGRFYKFVKKHFLQRRNTSNDVKEIRIVPDGDEFKWARRSAGSAASRSSNETTSSDGDRLEVVHDMAEEYTPEF
ncbi:uncharacterized protein LOC132712914 isoform X1 [Ruditapes philippinarum]|uniref:uncharacterized protein LOC132712914 isoform X1 n=1 Tax=Ruditapes philippinarum TaxID=129788 RepID=UPI00295C395B|nr:uncharacterized protein LOC132712914 isoform X1 [Ruditapes philippinarum]